MKTRISTAFRFTNVLSYIFSILIIAASALPVTGNVYAQEPNPRIVVSEAGDWFWTTGFSPGTLALSLYESADAGAALLWEGSRDADEQGFILVDYPEHGVDLLPGHYLVVANESAEKGIVLETISMEVLDTENEIMAGTAPPGREVWAMAGPQDWQQPVMVIADPVTGAWLADFKTVGFDITEEMRPWSFAHIYDEDGDANEANTPPPPPNPRMVVSITHDWFQAEEFSPGGTLNVKIYEERGGPLLWEENRTADESGFMVFEPWEHPVDLRPGLYLVISDGATTKDLMLEAVTLDVFDPSIDYLAGTAPPAQGGRPVWVGAGNENTGCGMDVIADPVSGAWEADFSTQPCDVTEDMWAAAQVFDEDGDASEGNLPRAPLFTVFPEWEAIEGWGWSQDATVHLEIDDPLTGQSPDHSQDAQVVPLPCNPNDIWVRFDFAGLYDVKPGDVVTLSEGATSRTHIVQNLAITGVNEVEDTVSGTAEEGETVYVWPHATGQQVQATAGSDGAWQVDFTGIFDLVSGECES